MAPTRPHMQTKNSNGKQVSLLNDDSTPSRETLPFTLPFRDTPYQDPTSMARSRSNQSGISRVSSPRTPDLLRSESYDSQMTNRSASPVTPKFMADSGRQSSYTSAGYSKGPAAQYEDRAYEYPPPYATSQAYPMHGFHFPETRVSYAEEPHYDEDAYGGHERGTKRYPCRFRDSHHCEKTFTTSGHASRHSKIHTAEKGVHCTFPNCSKKFTRADNMKQHLETHYKSKNEISGSGGGHSAKSSLTTSAGIKKDVRPPSRASRPRSGGFPTRVLETMDLAQFDPQLFVVSDRLREPYLSSSASSPYTSTPRTERPTAGLDVLANMAAMHNE